MHFNFYCPKYLRRFAFRFEWVACHGRAGHIYVWGQQTPKETEDCLDHEIIHCVIAILISRKISHKLDSIREKEWLYGT